MSPTGGDSPNESANSTRDVVHRFIEAFMQKDASAIPALVAEGCVMEAMQPAPDGERIEGFDRTVRFWQAMVLDPNGSFELEDVTACGEWAINRWRYRFGGGHEESVRGVTLIRVRNGKIAEALGYAKTTPRTRLGQPQERTIRGAE